MRVFLSHSSRDKPAVEALARHLREQGIDAWFDKWEIGPGDDIIARMNEGLEQADAGVIVFSAQSLESRWVQAEVSSLTHERIAGGQLLLPVQVGDDAYIPPLLRPFCRLRIEQHEQIADALRHRRSGPPPLGKATGERLERVRLQLQRRIDGGVAVAVRVADRGPFELVHGQLPAALVAGRRAFLEGASEAELLALGRALAAFCLTQEAAEALTRLLDGVGVGSTVLVEIETADPELLGLPFEALRLPDGRLLVIQPSVVLRRRLPATTLPPTAPLAGPLKLLVAVGAPDEGNTRSAVLDHEHELQLILDAVEPAQRLDNVQVKILEVGHPAQIAAAIEADAYHVLHLSCHGTPGQLELEDELGGAVLVSAEQLVQPLRSTGRPLPLVVLNTCHGGVEAGTTTSLAQALIQAGIPSVVAMQTSVSDSYASELARRFYQHLSQREPVLAGRALAAARRGLEEERLRRLAQGVPGAAARPEVATAAFYGAGEEQPLADFGLDKQPLSQPPVRQMLGPVPQLAVGDLVGRRRELRTCLRRLRDGRAPGGVVLSGIGGVGKSSVAGRVMQRLAEDGWTIASHSGRFDLRAIGEEVGLALAERDPGQLSASARRAAELLLNDDLRDDLRLRSLQKLLLEESLLLVLDDFEQNLSVGGERFLDPDTLEGLEQLLARAQRGALLLTCRHPLPQAMEWLQEVPLGPLSSAETRKLVQRLPGLRERPDEDLSAVLRTIGGHPRLLEFLDALLSQGKGRLPAVTQRLRKSLNDCGLPVGAAPASLVEGVQQALALGVRDVLLEELLAIARQRGDDAVLLQLAVSNLPLDPAGLAQMLEGQVAPAAVEPALGRLAALSLVVRAEGSKVRVHRWTAEGLAAMVEAADQADRCRRAGDYRIWRLQQGSPDLADAIEATRNYLQGGHLDQAIEVGQLCLDALRRLGQTVSLAALAAEVLETLPEGHSGFARFADAEASAHLDLGQSERAFARYGQLQERLQVLAKAEPDRADYQRDLSVSYNKMGDLYRALGQGEAARVAYQGSLEIRERLAKAEPDRADYQRDLSVSYFKLATSVEPPERRLLKYAVVILQRLDQQGRLSPSDQPILLTLQQMLD